MADLSGKLMKKTLTSASTVLVGALLLFSALRPEAALGETEPETASAAEALQLLSNDRASCRSCSRSAA